MKTLRLVLLLLVAMLLPLRGAVAASMACGPAGGHPVAQSAAMHHGATQASHQAHGDHGTADMEAAHAEHHSADAQGDDGKASERCLLCAACCSAQPMPASVPSVPEPLPAAAAAFPAPFTPALSFLSDGQERPPRSI